MLQSSIMKQIQLSLAVKQLYRRQNCYDSAQYSSELIQFTSTTVSILQKFEVQLWNKFNFSCKWSLQKNHKWDNKDAKFIKNEVFNYKAEGSSVIVQFNSFKCWFNSSVDVAKFNYETNSINL